jgi:replication factor C subunit 3/5
MSYIPWVEKYRPKQFDEVILDDTNKIILNKMIEINSIVNILAYGFPGTGKTTTIINFVNLISRLQGDINSSSIIHLNASDDRGVDVIRTQIQTFVNSKSLFKQGGLKFVILDEVDYMTKAAQQSLKYLIQTNSKQVKFFLICNYVSRIDDGLKNEFIKLPFHFMNPESVVALLQRICIEENIVYKREELTMLRAFFSNDIRSMINYLQSNHNSETLTNLESLHNLIKTEDDQNKICDYVQTMCVRFNMHEKMLILYYLHFLQATEKSIFFKESFLNFVENLLHSKKMVPNSIFLKYSILKLKHNIFCIL